jgi:hypothetical protein
VIDGNGRSPITAGSTWSFSSASPLSRASRSLTARSAAAPGRVRCRAMRRTAATLAAAVALAAPAARARRITVVQASEIAR